MSLYTVGGISVNNGKVKVRFCSDLVLRIKNLQKQGDTDIMLIELPGCMTKIDVCRYLLGVSTFAKYHQYIENNLIKQLGLREGFSSKKIVVPVETNSEIEELEELVAA